MSLTSYRTAPPRAGFSPRSCKPEPNHTGDTGDFPRLGDDLLSHALRRSTIGATVLNGRVRDGIGCFTRAMITKPGKISGNVTLSHQQDRKRTRPSQAICSGSGEAGLPLDQIKPIGQLVPVS